MNAGPKPLVEITETAIWVLSRELGAADTARFLNQFTTGVGNYTEDRDQIIGESTVNELVGELKRRRSAESQAAKTAGKSKRSRRR